MIQENSLKTVSAGGNCVYSGGCFLYKKCDFYLSLDA